MGPAVAVLPIAADAVDMAEVIAEARVEATEETVAAATAEDTGLEIERVVATGLAISPMAMVLT